MSRAYRMLLRLLPRGFRERHGAAMEESFGELHAAAQRSGRTAVARLWVREALDLCRAAGRVRAADAALAAEARLPNVHRRGFIGSFRDDVRLALRASLRNRAFFVLGAVTLGLGVGATTAMYGAFRAVVLEPLPFAESERLAVPWRIMGAGALIGLDRSDTEALRLLPELFSAVEQFGPDAATVKGAVEPVRMDVVRMTPGLPALLGTPPVLGRTFTSDEVAGAGAPVLLLSYALWQSWFDGRDDVLGRTLSVDGASRTIIGVMPPRAARPDGDARAVDLWLPLTDGDWRGQPIVRLADGVTIEAASERLDALLELNAPRDFTGGTLVPVITPGPLHGHLRMLMAAVVLLLLVACVNVSNLLLQRAAERRMELAVRSSLGALRGRLARQLLLESLLLAGAGAMLGAAFAWAGLRALLALRPEQLEVLRTARVDGSVLLFCVATATAAGVVFGLVPALRGSRVPQLAVLGRGARGGASAAGGGRWLLVSAEVALSFALLLGAVMLAASLRELAARDPGYAVDELAAIDVQLPPWRYAEPALRRDVYDRMLADVRRHPRVRSVSLADGVPPRMRGRFGRVRLDDDTRDPSPTRFAGATVDSAFLRTIGQPVIAGRDFARSDIGSPLKPILLSASTARALFSGESAIGHTIALEGEPPNTVIGIVRDIDPAGLAEQSDAPLVYWLIDQPRLPMTLVLRADAPTPQLLEDLRQIVRRSEPDAIVDVATVRELLGDSLARERFTTTLLSTFSLLALLLAVVGLYGVVSQVVTSRTHEFGIRVALGATTARVGALVMQTGAAAIAAGLAVGAVLAAAGMRVLGSQIFGLTAQRPTAYAAAAITLVLASLLAMLVPTVRATRVDPTTAIRADG